MELVIEADHAMHIGTAEVQRRCNRADRVFGNVAEFGLHIVQVLERREVTVEPRQLREQARAQLRERKFDEAYKEWISDLRSRAFIEMRDAPL